MCGLCGIAFTDPSRHGDGATLLRMRDSLTHRGPDDAGHYLSPGIALGSRRLAIQDLSERGHMPMASTDGRYHIAYNGEVYNFQALRSHLEARGFTFRSHTDTEVLLNLYIDEGPKMLDRLNGMFAFAIWDDVDRSLFLARDRLGVKPVYYAQNKQGLLFASEEKALFAAGLPAQFNHDCWEELLLFRYVAGEGTPFVGVHRLLPGHYLTWRAGNLKITRWWHLAEKAQNLRESAQPLDEWYRETFDSSVNLRKISDVPVGVLLSGGLDSGSVASSLALQTESKISTFTVRFTEAGYDEGPLAKQLTEQYKLDYHELKITPENLMSQLRDAAWFNDEPLAHGNDPHILAISAYAKPKVTVLLSGEGADETLGGYVRYRPLQYPGLLSAAQSFRPAIAPFLEMSPRLRKLRRFLSLGSIDRFILFNTCDMLPQELDIMATASESRFTYREKVLSDARSVYPGDPMRQAMYSDMQTFLCSLLDRNDRMTMGASIECRVPFLDYRLVEGLAASPSSSLLSRKESKHLLRSAIGNRLPEAIRTGRKWGFGVPWARYFREIPEFRALVENLPTSMPIREGAFDPAALRNAIAEFLAGNDSRAPLIRQLAMIAVWHETYFTRLQNVQYRPAQAHQAS